ncbi:hypothetical protein EJV47_17795 [Hymenobacter gummosus]|uniref:Uncharacterized protein n=1 Tax=Hymenobacter gummosus TaxID=1776032 RepID=A0A431TZ96_9BACT|nr:hypothetical protein [Hymenobacter gummosus]RTQ47774.1 hypothetical protein EJV47_17795 [Hymenobacter gummosus]
MATTPNHPHPEHDADKPASASRRNDGSNDNPDEFSEFRKSDAPGTEDYSRESEQADPWAQPGHVEQNQNPEAVKATENSSNDAKREAWAKDDPRYGSGPRPATPDEAPKE